MDEVLVKIWDDRILRDEGGKVEAAERLVLEYRGTRYRLDLTEGNAGRLDADLEPWLAAAQKLARDGTAPQMVHGFRPGSAEARRWRTGLREWAAAQGRDGEVHVQRTGRKRNYTYALELERDYQNHLLEKAAGYMVSQVA